MKQFVMLLACLSVLCVQPAEAATISYTPAADGYANSIDGGVTWSVTDTTGPGLFVSLDGNNEVRSALEFDIDPSAHSGETIVSATLWLYAGLFDTIVGVYGYEGNGTIELGDFADNPPQTATFDPEPVNSINVTAFVSVFGNRYAGFQLRELIDPNYNAFSSSEGGGTGSVPRLDIVYAPVPEPSTMILLGSGLAGLVGYGRRRFKK